ncbi:MAG: hypothetical protein R3270_01055 [Gammaproteobacteria bacterium]|nr:hypothetical protein [Gammaproteobacteria bacterium]
MGQLVMMLSSLLLSGLGIAIYLSGLDGDEWVTRAVAAGVVTVALAISDIGHRRYRDLTLGKLAAGNALLFALMVLYSLYLNSTA